VLVDGLKISQALLIELAHASSVRCSLGNKVEL
jgi:hypothetical protein